MASKALTKANPLKAAPTGTAANEWQVAYDFFNKRLFADQLPPCMITMHRHKKAYGYFWGKRYQNNHKKVADEIGMNPDYLSLRTDRESLSTLVHEMVHLRQHHFGKESRNGYHNKEWGIMMDEIGLTPSSTGQPGGKRTGQKVSHYIVKDGLYDEAMKELAKTGFKITWKSSPTPQKEKGASGKKVKYTCSICEQNAWAKPGAALLCGFCPPTKAGKYRVMFAQDEIDDDL